MRQARGYYDDIEMSVRAYNAIQNGELPLNRINKAKINELIETAFKNKEIDEEEKKDIESLKVSTIKSFIKNSKCLSAGWHHMSDNYTEVDFYDTVSLIEIIIEYLPEILEAQKNNNTKHISFGGFQQDEQVKFMLARLKAKNSA